MTEQAHETKQETEQEELAVSVDDALRTACAAFANTPTGGTLRRLLLALREAEQDIFEQGGSHGCPPAILALSDLLEGMVPREESR